MKVAIVHDYLNTKDGGAEQVLRDLLALYPSADLFTLIYNKKRFASVVGGRLVKASNLQWAPGWFKKHPQFLLPLIRRAVNKLDFTGYDLIISSSGAWCKNITVPAEARHICYCHSPARMLWVDWPSYVDSYHFWGWRIIPFSRLWLTRLCSRLRLWDYYQSADVDQFIANSEYVAGRIDKFYHRSSAVVYPGVDTEVIALPVQPPTRDYFLVVASLARYKNLDVVIAACRAQSQRLVIAGDGADRARLETVAAGDELIEFRGFVSETEKISLLKGARALIVANVEDFGITPIEAMAAGTPVVALRGGGIAETVRDGRDGVLFEQSTAESLSVALERLKKLQYDPKQLREHAQRFDRDRFRAQFSRLVGGHGQH